MNRTDSLKVINAFIAELGAPAKPAAPAAKPIPKAEPALAPRPAPAVSNPPQSGGLGDLVTGCAGFEIGHVAPAAAPQAQEGLGALIQGCAGFEIGAQANACEPEPAAVIEPAKEEAPPEPVIEATPEAAAARKALANLSNKPLLLSLLQYYASESQRPTPSRSMLKTTKEQVMKHWPQLTLTPLITALDGAAS